MRAVAIHEYGGPEVLRLEDCPEPVVRENDVLVAVYASSVNPVDTKVRRTQSSLRTLPLILGFDVSGVVVRCGSRVTRWKPGDEVIAAPNLFRHGADAEYVSVDARSAAHKPNNVDHATAASLPLVSQTAWEALHLRARIQPGQTILIQAGAGGVGHIAVQLARLHGCRVITTAGRDESISFCQDVLRADAVIDYRRGNVVERVRDLTQGQGVPVIIDTVGGEVFQQSLDCAAINAQIVTIVGSDTGDRGRALLYKNVSIHYEFMAIPTAYELEPERPGQILTAIGNLVQRELLRPHVSRRFSLENLADAHRQVETGRTIGKVVVTVRD